MVVRSRRCWTASNVPKRDATSEWFAHDEDVVVGLMVVRGDGGCVPFQKISSSVYRCCTPMVASRHLACGLLHSMRVMETFCRVLHSIRPYGGGTKKRVPKALGERGRAAFVRSA